MLVNNLEKRRKFHQGAKKILVLYLSEGLRRKFKIFFQRPVRFRDYERFLRKSYSISSPSPSFAFWTLEASNPPNGTPGVGGLGAPGGGIGAPGTPEKGGMGGRGAPAVGAGGLGGGASSFMPSILSKSKIPGGGAVGLRLVGTTLGPEALEGLGGAGGGVDAPAGAPACGEPVEPGPEGRGGKPGGKAGPPGLGDPG